MPEKTKRGNPIADGYVTVAERIEKFYEKYPEGRIITQIVEHEIERGFILIRTEVYRNNDDALPIASGHAYEIKTEGYVQRTSYIEVCETSSVGRALAMAGFEVKKGIASREEMRKVKLTDEQYRNISDLRVKLNQQGFFKTSQDAKDHLLTFTEQQTDNAKELDTIQAASYIEALKRKLKQQE